MTLEKMGRRVCSVLADSGDEHGPPLVDDGGRSGDQGGDDVEADVQVGGGRGEWEEEQVTAQPGGECKVAQGLE